MIEKPSLLVKRREKRERGRKEREGEKLCNNKMNNHKNNHDFSSESKIGRLMRKTV